VIDIDRILGTAAIPQDVVTPTIPYGLLPKCRIEKKAKYEHARENNKGNLGSGSELYVVSSATLKFEVSEKHLYEPTSDSGEEI